MSSSNPPRSPIAAKLRASSPQDGRPTLVKRSLGHRLAIKFAAIMRWLHIYLSMIGLATILFFSVTGITLNHPNWFEFLATDRTQNDSGQLETRWLNLPIDESSRPDGDLTKQVDKFEVVEYLRKTHRIHGHVADLRVDDRECMIAFKGPGYSADVFININTGKYTLTQNLHGAIAVMNDLHKGRDTGPVWSVVIDVSAIVMTIVSLSGLVLLFYLKRRRMTGTLVVLIGSVVMLILYEWGVP